VISITYHQLAKPHLRAMNEKWTDWVGVAMAVAIVAVVVAVWLTNG